VDRRDAVAREYRPGGNAREGQGRWNELRGTKVRELVMSGVVVAVTVACSSALARAVALTSTFPAVIADGPASRRWSADRAASARPRACGP
jgi:hypothetical protein